MSAILQARAWTQACALIPVQLMDTNAEHGQSADRVLLAEALEALVKADMNVVF